VVQNAFAAAIPTSWVEAARIGSGCGHHAVVVMTGNEKWPAPDGPAFQPRPVPPQLADRPLAGTLLATRLSRLCAAA
jgi:hypothetical protein